MKKILITTVTVLLTSVICFGQTKPDTAKYTIAGDKNINLLYGLLQAGYQAVQKSDDFSKTQVKQYMVGLLHLDSLLRPQIIKFHPDTTKKK